MCCVHGRGERGAWRAPRVVRPFWTLTLLTIVLSVPPAHANVVSRFSLATGEVYSDNIFFSQNKESDFVTLLAPTLSLAYKPSGYPEPTFNLSLSSPVEIFARHSELNNIGDNIGLNASYIYHYSPRLDLTFTERLLRRGESRTGGFDDTGEGGGIGGLGGLGGGRGGSSLGSLGGLSGGGFGSFGGFGGDGSCGESGSSRARGGTALESGDLVTRGERLENQIAGNVNFQYSPNLSFGGGYCWDANWFFDEGGKEIEHAFNVEGSYQLWNQHTLRIRYTVSLFRSRDGQDEIVHDFDIGDEFLGGFLEKALPLQREIALTPTLRVRASTGIAVRTPASGDGQFGLEHKLNLELIKVWRTAELVLGARRDLTGSFGVSGPSFTTEFFSRFTFQLSRRLAVSSGAELALFDAEDANFSTFQAFVGLQYWLTNWLSTNITYSYNWTDSESGSAAREVLGRGKIDSNTVFLFFAVHFDVWPRFGLAKEGLGSPLGPASGSPAGRVPLPRTP